MANNKIFLVGLAAGAVMVVLVFGALRLAGVVSIGSIGGSVSAPPTGMEKVVHDYLIQHPEVIVEAMNGYQAKESERELARIREGAKKNEAELYREPDPIVAGNPNGDVTMVEFFDYHCPYCKKVRDELVQLLKDDPKLRLVLKEFPILTPESELAARAAIAAQMQGKYWPMHLALLGSDDISEPAIMAIAKQVGLDVERLKRDMTDQKVTERLQRTMKLAKAMSVEATPTFIIGTEPASGAYPVSKLKEMVAAARKAQNSASN